MRHDGERVAAPWVDDPKWLEGFRQALREAGIAERAMPYCIE